MVKSIEEFVANNEQESILLAQNIANNLNSNDIVVFQGDLGAGKTFLCRSIIQYLLNDNINVASPTFNLLQTYESQSLSYSIYHFDLYRLQSIDEIYELGIEEAFTNHICLIEWPEIIKSILPRNTIYITIDIVDINVRKITVQRNIN